jgi:hypothetical protein
MSTPNTIGHEALHQFYMTLFHLIFRNDDRLRTTTIEAIRKIIQNPIPTHPLSPSVQELLQSLRDDLLASPDPNIVAALSQSPLRPIDKK